jgi:hypothetical protein
MATSTILVATWREGLFAVDGDRRKQEITNQSVRGLVSDGRSGALAIVDGHSLRRRAPDGDWTTIATSEYALSCCIAAGEAIFAGTDDARLLQLSDEGSGTLVRVDGFDNVAGRETWFAGSAMVNGQRMGPPLGIRSLAASATEAYCSPTFMWEAFRVPWMAEERGSPPSISIVTSMKCARTLQISTLLSRQPRLAFALAATQERRGPSNAMGCTRPTALR